MIEDLWKEHQIGEDIPALRFVLDKLHVWIQHRNGEIWIARQFMEPDLDNNNDVIGSDPEPPEELTWSRWAFESDIKNISIKPVFPNLPIVISSKFPLHVSPGARIQVFCRIPAWIRIELRDPEYILTEIPVMGLSRTWFGNPFEGELCYWVTTHARRSLENVEPKSFYVNCPIWITNKGKEDLNFENFCLRVERLGIHRVENELWTGETNIVHHGGDSNSDITMTRELPSYLGDGVLLSEARNPFQTSFAIRTFKKLFDDSFFSAR